MVRGEAAGVKPLDGRHRWEITERKAATVTHTCRVCGRTVTFELFVPDAIVETIIAIAFAPNPFRALVR